MQNFLQVFEGRITSITKWRGVILPHANYYLARIRICFALRPVALFELYISQNISWAPLSVLLMSISTWQRFKGRVTGYGWWGLMGSYRNIKQCWGVVRGYGRPADWSLDFIGLHYQDPGEREQPEACEDANANAHTLCTAPIKS